MRYQWLAFLAFGFLTLVVFVFFVIRLLPLNTRPAAENPGEEIPSVPTVTFYNPSRGPAAAPVTVVVFSDFTCAHCRDLAANLAAAAKAAPQSFRLVWKYLPNPNNPLSALAAVAAACAARQGQFWAYHDQLYARQDSLNEPAFSAIAAGLKLDAAAFEKCYTAKDTQPLVDNDAAEAAALQVTAVPTVFIGAARYVGALDTQEITNYVEQALEK